VLSARSKVIIILLFPYFAFLIWNMV
jgi:hypothetical protein